MYIGRKVMSLNNEEQARKEFDESGIREDFGISFFGSCGLVLAAITHFNLETPNILIGTSYAGGAVALVLLHLSKTKKKKNKILRNDNTNTSIEAVLETVYQILLVTVSKDEPSPGLRLTIYDVSPDKTKLAQYTGYFGENIRDSGNRHIIERSKGLVGAAFRTQKVVPLNRHPKVSDEQFLEDMVKGFGFTADEALKLKSDRRSWIALPVEENDVVHAVLYCDSNVFNFFASKRKIRFKILEAACAGLAEFLAKK